MVSGIIGLLLFIVSFVCLAVHSSFFARRRAAVNERLEPTERPFNFMVSHPVKWMRFEDAYKRLRVDPGLKRAESFYGVAFLVTFFVGVYLMGTRPF